MRGKPRCHYVCMFSSRITPADAGKTAFRLADISIQPDHPRGCGENFLSRTSRQRREGSPPRMRGKHTTAFLFLLGVRITPADAGKTWRAFEHGELNEDHPRGCGENESRKINLRGCKGSPPRMRGKLRSTLLQGINRKDHPRGCGENTKKIL